MRQSLQSWLSHRYVTLYASVTYIQCHIICWRIGVLGLHELKVEHFASLDEALDKADKLIAHQREMLQGVAERHPDIIIGDKMLDQFWYCKHDGILGELLGMGGG